MKRREFVALVSGAVLSGLWKASAQEAGRSYRIGWLGSTPASFTEPYSLGFVKRMSELGFVEGSNLSIERRQADSKLEKLPALAAELAKLKCDVFFGGGVGATLAALTAADGDTPIIYVSVDFDPVATGDVASLARPGGR